MGAMHRLFRDWKDVEVDSRVFFGRFGVVVVKRSVFESWTEFDVESAADSFI